MIAFLLELKGQQQAPGIEYVDKGLFAGAIGLEG